MMVGLRRKDDGWFEKERLWLVREGKIMVG